MAAQIDRLSRSLMRVVRPSAVSAAGWPKARWRRGTPPGAVQLRRGEALLHGPERAPPLPETRCGAYVTDNALRARLGCSADRRAASALTTPSASAGVISSSTSLPIASAITVSSKLAIGGVAGLNAAQPRSMRTWYRSGETGSTAISTSSKGSMSSQHSISFSQSHPPLPKLDH